MHERRFNPEHMAKLESPERRAALPPEKLIDKLAVRESSIVLDLGAGTGYLTLPAAKRTHETVYALDIEPKMLEVISRKAEEQALNNVKTVEGALEQVPLEDESVDRVIASLVLHEAEPLQMALAEIFRVLRPGGLCLCLEWEKKDSNQGPPIHHRIALEELKSSSEALGFNVTETDHPTNDHYLIVLLKG